MPLPANLRQVAVADDGDDLILKVTSLSNEQLAALHEALPELAFNSRMIVTVDGETVEMRFTDIAPSERKALMAMVAWLRSYDLKGMW